MSTFSLDRLRDDPDFSAIFGKRKEAVRQNKTDLLEAAKEFSDKYRDEINAGTKKRQLMLESGRKQGLSEEKIFENTSIFIPNDKTPILNMLFFLLREHGDLSANVTVLREAKHLERNHAELREELNRLHGSEMLNEVIAMAEALPNAKGFVYGKVGTEGFNVLKKLKSMASSKNEQEAFVAYRKCRELCERLGVEFDKVPTNN